MTLFDILTGFNCYNIRDYFLQSDMGVGGKMVALHLLTGSRQPMLVVNICPTLTPHPNWKSCMKTCDSILDITNQRFFQVFYLG